MNIREKIQQEAVQALLDNNLRGLLAMTMRSGKTITSLRAIMEYQRKHKQSHKPNILFLAERVARKNTLQEELKDIKKYTDYNPAKEIGSIHFNTYQAYQNDSEKLIKCLKDRNIDVVILDEVHDCATTTRYHIIETLHRLNLPTIGLSGTPASYIKMNKEDPFSITKGQVYKKYLPIIYTYNSTNAVEDDIWQPYDVYIVEHFLDRRHKNIEIGYKKYKTGPNAKRLVSEQEGYTWFYTKSVQYYGKPDKKFLMFRLISGYKKILYNAKSKLDRVKILLNKLEGPTLVIIKEGITSKCFEYLNIPYVSGNLNLAANQSILEDFKKGKIKVLGTSEYISQGTTLTQIENVIIVSYNASPKDMDQKAARGFNPRSGENSKVFIFKTVGTQEEKWFDKATTNLLSNAEQCYHIGGDSDFST